jgi:hypothetical protein
MMRKNVVIYDPSFNLTSQSGQIAKVSYASRRSVIMACQKRLNLRGSNAVYTEINMKSSASASLLHTTLIYSRQDPWRPPLC